MQFILSFFLSDFPFLWKNHTIYCAYNNVCIVLCLKNLFGSNGFPFRKILNKLRKRVKELRINLKWAIICAQFLWFCFDYKSDRQWELYFLKSLHKPLKIVPNLSWMRFLTSTPFTLITNSVFKWSPIRIRNKIHYKFDITSPYHFEYM